jgi:hypothetical protein
MKGRTADQGTQAALYKVDGKDTYVVSFRGSEGTGHCTKGTGGLLSKLTSNCMQEFLDDWLYTDLRNGGVAEDICPDTKNPYKRTVAGRLSSSGAKKSGKQVHKGFYQAYMSVRDDLRAALANELGPDSTPFSSLAIHSVVHWQLWQATISPAPKSMTSYQR